MISLQSIARGATTRFAAGVVAFFAVAFVLTAGMKGNRLGLAQVAGFGMIALSLTGGFIVSAVMMRRWLNADSGIARRRSLAAGFAAPLVLLYLGVLRGSPISHGLLALLALAAGAATTLLMFLPTLSARDHSFELRQQVLLAIGTRARALRARA